MFKKHMTPLTKNGTLDNAGKNPVSSALSAARGGQQNFQTYAKATPMAGPQDQPAPPPDGLGSGTWGGNGIA
jgi:predicted HNH restriction endonuclease